MDSCPNHTSAGWKVVLSVCIAAAALVACDAQLTADNPVIAATATHFPPMPRNLRIALPPDNLDSVDFFALRGCALQVTVGKFHSSLGRRASDAQRLLLDLEYLRLAPPCIARQKEQGRVNLAQFLAEINQLKRKQLAASMFNATLAGNSFQQFWSSPVQVKSQSRRQQLALSAMLAIHILVKQWLSGDYRASNIGFEIHLSEVATGRALIPGPQAVALRCVLEQLERQLWPSLPYRYRQWQAARERYFAAPITPAPYAGPTVTPAYTDASNSVNCPPH